MVEIITGVTAAARITMFIANYQNYRYDKRKEDDAALRRWLMDRLNGCREHTLNLMEMAYRADNTTIEGETKQILDALDLFKNEVHLAEAGQRLPFFTAGSSTSIKGLKKLLEFDAELLEEVDRVSKAIAELELAIGAGEEGILKSVLMIKTGVSKARNHFRDRIQFIKGQV